ncbi:MAG: hypothetical protein K6G80_03105 [Treponema sp.]|nr:hypothetical protein [Treponema sp.]
MKKHVLVSAVLSVCATLFAQEAPAFSDPKAVVCDISAIPGKAKGDICVINATHETNLAVSVSVYDAKAKQWVEYGTGTLDAIVSTATVSSSLRGKLKNYAYVAAVPATDKEVKVLFSKVNNNLCISVLSLEEPSEYATVMDVFSLNGTFKNTVILDNQTEDAGVGFDIYTQKDNSDTWFKVGTAYTAASKERCTVTVVTPDAPETYRYYAVIAHNGKDYSYEAKKENNALILTAR